MANPFLSMLKGILDKVQEKNAKDPNVKTADPSVFEDLNKKVATNDAPDFGSILNNVKEVKVANEVNPNVETADNSVFDDMMKEIEELKAKVAAKEAAAPAPTPEVKSAPAAPSFETSEIVAMTNSNGGSLALRAEPNMGAAVNNIRVPDSSVIKILEYSDVAIILDGQKTKFVLVEFDGQRGWVLDSYLNFN